MRNLVVYSPARARLLPRLTLALAAIMAAATNAKADLFTDVGTEITGMVTSTNTLLGLGIPLVIAFIVFGLVKKAGRKAAA